MSRTISSDRLARLGLPNQSFQSPVHGLHPALINACVQTNKSCLHVISRAIENEVRSEFVPAELMAVLLACAQISQSTTTLAKCDSAHLASLVQALKIACETCIAVSNLHEAEGLAECRETCVRTLEVCAEMAERRDDDPTDV